MENQSKLELNEQAVEALESSAKWCTFLAVMGFVGIGFMVLAGLMMGSVMSSLPMGDGPFANIKQFITFFYVIMAGIYFPPVYYLYRYASDMKHALLNSSSDMVSTALNYLKSHHKYLGISIIVILSLYIILIIGIVSTAASHIPKM